METVAHDGRETAYRIVEQPGASAGNHPPVLYVHGSGGTHRVWVEQYAQRDHTAVALDLSGHGESDDVDTPAGPATLDAYADDVVAVARETGARVLAGNSLGGAIAQHVVLERDLDLDAVVLTGTGAKLSVADFLQEQLADDFEAAIETVHSEDMLFHDASDEVLEESARMMRDCGRAVTERDFLTCDEFDVRDRLDECSVPALALTGEYDRLTPVSFHEYLAEELPAGELAVVDDGAHLSFLEQPEEWNAAVDAFLDGLD